MWVTTWEGETSEGHSKGGCAVPAKLAAGDSEAGSPTTSVGRVLSPQHLRPPPAEPLLPQNQPSHRKMNIAHCEIFVMKRIPGWIFFFFSKHFAAFKNSFHSILSWPNVFLSRKKNKNKASG